MGPRQEPMLLGLASSPNFNGFGMQLDPRLLGPPFKSGLKLLSLVFSQTHLNLGKFIVIIITLFLDYSQIHFLFFSKKKETVSF
jgi:hypothetical protein